MLDVLDIPQTLAGWIQLSNGIRTVPRRKNLVLFEAASIMTKLLAGDAAYQIAGIYLEYANVLDAGDPVIPPVYDRGEAHTYYAALASDPDRDYLRLPLATKGLSSGDLGTYPAGNVAAFHSQTLQDVTTGVHGKPFGGAATSRIYGAALVAIPFPNDRSRDLLFSRYYWDAAEQLVKAESKQISVLWDLEAQ